MGIHPGSTAPETVTNLSPQMEQAVHHVDQVRPLAPDIVEPMENATLIHPEEDAPRGSVGTDDKKTTAAERNRQPHPTKSAIDDYTPQFFFKLAHVAKEMNRFKPWERALIFAIGRYLSRGWPISEKMERQALRIIEEAKLSGLSSEIQQQIDSEQAERTKPKKELPDRGKQLPKDLLVQVDHLSKQGCSLDEIANNFGVSVTELQESIERVKRDINKVLDEVFRDDN